MKNTEVLMRSNFDVIYKTTIGPLLLEFAKKYNLKCQFSFVKFLIRHYYCREANTYIQSYMVSETKEIDKHKIAACLVKSILETRPLRIPLKTKLLQIMHRNIIDSFMLLSNEYLAVSVAISVLESYIGADDTKDLKHCIVFPETFPNNENDYIRDLCLCLFYTSPHKISVMAYANIFFLLEKYSCRRIRSENLSNWIEEELQKVYNLNKNEIAEKINNIELGCLD